MGSIPRSLVLNALTPCRAEIPGELVTTTGIPVAQRIGCWRVVSGGNGSNTGTAYRV